MPAQVGQVKGAIYGFSEDPEEPGQVWESWVGPGGPGKARAVLGGLWRARGAGGLGPRVGLALGRLWVGPWVRRWVGPWVRRWVGRENPRKIRKKSGKIQENPRENRKGNRGKT